MTARAGGTKKDPQGPDVDSLRGAYDHCAYLASRHYENFPVASLLVPRNQRGAVAAIYAFARGADDLADEALGPGPKKGRQTAGARSRVPAGMDQAMRRLTLLRAWEAQLDRPARDPVFLALHDAIRRFQVPKQLLRDLVSAFKQDVVKNRYRNFGEVLDYCRRSANPVGRLVLRLFNRDDPESVGQSDAICTALQLANFWQDLGLDMVEKNRLYLPQNEMKKEGVNEADLKRRRFSPALARLMALQVQRTRNLFVQGVPLVQRMPGRLGLELRLTWLGGMEVLRKVEAQGFDTLSHRPKLARLDWARLALKAFLGMIP